MDLPLCLLRRPLCALLLACAGPLPAAPWVADQGDGTYRNPILFADYSDPDVVKVGDDFYMTASSFNAMPGLPILHSVDLVNWEVISYAIETFPGNHFDTPQHGNGIWAPSIRHHDGMFIIYWGDPDLGLFRVQAEDPRGPWSAPILVKEAKGNIDPCPLWDDDGRVYVVHAFANSRAGVSDVLQVQELTPDGAEVTRNRKIVFNGADNHPTLEGPKFHKRNDYYYIFAPAGGVATGWQVVLRSRHVFGPYEDRVVLSAGETGINGPHQGAYIELDNGEGWFIHFQERQPYGRITHLQPVRWVDDWPVIGEDPDGDGNGQPVMHHRKPATPRSSPPRPLVATDEFDDDALNLAWQWHANWHPSWSSLSAAPGQLRLHARAVPRLPATLWNTGSLLLQKLPAPAFTATTKLDASGLQAGERAGLVMMGLDYAFLAVRGIEEGRWSVEYAVCEDAQAQTSEKVRGSDAVDTPHIWLQVEMAEGGLCQFAWSPDGKTFTLIGEPFQAREGRWIGAKVGLTAVRPSPVGLPGWADFEYFHLN